MNRKLSSLFRVAAYTCVAAAFASSSWAAGKYSTETADYYKAQYDTFEGKTIRLEVTHIQPFAYKSNIEDLRFFHAYTYDRDKRVPGGWIVVCVPKDDVMAFVKRYGTVPSGMGESGGMLRSQTTKLSGVLRADGKRFWFLDYENKAQKLLDARRQQLMVEPASDTNNSSTNSSMNQSSTNNTSNNGATNSSESGSSQGNSSTNSSNHQQHQSNDSQEHEKGGWWGWLGGWGH